MPGSRHGEFSRHLRPFLQTARQCWQSDPGLVFAGNLIDSDKQAEFERVARELAPDMPVFSYVNESRCVLEACDVALLASGTITLEAMLYKKPMVIAYRLSGFSYHVLKALIASPWVGLPNILAQQTLVPEFFQNRVTAHMLAPALMRWLQAPEAVAELQSRFTDMHSAMKLDTNDRAARAVLALCRK